MENFDLLEHFRLKNNNEAKKRIIYGKSEVYGIFEDHAWIRHRSQDNHYTCFLSCNSINEIDTKITAYTGEHLEGRNNKDVTAISFQSSHIKYFPRDLHKIFPNLKVFEIIMCKLSTIRREDLIGLENIEELYLDGNELNSLPNNLLTNMKCLKKFSALGNDLRFVSSKVLSPIPAEQWEFIDLRPFDDVHSLIYSRSRVGINGFKTFSKMIDEFLAPQEDEVNFSGITKRNYFEGFHQQMFESQCRDLWNTKENADLNIVTNKGSFKVHKKILSIVSKHFDVTVDKTHESVIFLKEFREEAVEEFFKHIYTKSIPGKENAMEVLMLADMHDLSELKEICERIIQENINQDNAVEIFTLGHLHNCKDIKSLAFFEIKRKYPDSGITDEIKDDFKALNKVLAEINRPSIKNVMRWAKEKLK